MTTWSRSLTFGGALVALAGCAVNAVPEEETDELVSTNPEPLVIGSDDRQSSMNSANTELLTAAESVALMLPKTSVINSPVNGLLLELAWGPWGGLNSAGGLKKEHNLCDNELFWEEPVTKIATPICSAFLISPTRVVTAKSCFNSLSCADTAFVFKHEVDSLAPFNVYLAPLSSDDIYNCKRVIRTGEQSLDYAVVELDRPATQTPLDYKFTPDLSQYSSNPVAFAGHPSGLPKKVQDLGVVVDDRHDTRDYFLARYDVFNGDQGGPALQWNEVDYRYEVAGILSGTGISEGNDYIPDPNGQSCNVLNVSASGSRTFTYINKAFGSKFGNAAYVHDYFAPYDEEPHVGDLDGDGDTDIVTFIKDAWAEPAAGDVWIAKWNAPIPGSGTAGSFGTGTKWHENLCRGAEQCALGDINGDKKDDVIVFKKSTSTGDVMVAYNTGSSFGPAQKVHDYFCVANELCTVADMNKDGKADLVTMTANSVWVALGPNPSNSQLWADNTPCAGGTSPSYSCMVGDISGDGYPDLLLRTAGSSGYVGYVHWAVRMGSSTGFGVATPLGQLGGPGAPPRSAYFGNSVLKDVTGDGRADMVYMNPYGATVSRSLGLGFEAGTPWSVMSSPEGCYATYNPYGVCRVGELNKDGRADLIKFTRQAYANVFVYLAQ